eukprot:PhF_6_TR828/c1_g1_i2/m.1256
MNHQNQHASLLINKHLAILHRIYPILMMSMVDVEHHDSVTAITNQYIHEIRNADPIFLSSLDACEQKFCDYVSRFSPPLQKRDYDSVLKLYRQLLSSMLMAEEGVTVEKSAPSYHHDNTIRSFMTVVERRQCMAAARNQYYLQIHREMNDAIRKEEETIQAATEKQRKELMDDLEKTERIGVNTVYDADW